MEVEQINHQERIFKFQKYNLGAQIDFEKSLTSNVTTAWGVEWDERYIARDILQNFYDANRERVDEITIRRVAHNTIIISAPGQFNIERLFYLGSEKTNDDVGKYGEGFKAAAVCLLRDFNIHPIAVSGKDIYYIRLSDTAIAGSRKMFPLIYDHYISTEPITGSELILENCSPKLADVMQEGLSSFFFTKNHPLIGDHLGEGCQGRVDVYLSKNGQGYIYFERLLRAELGNAMPLIFSFNHAYSKIRKAIGKDRDRKTFTRTADLDVFISEMNFAAPTGAAMLRATKNVWSKGKGHPILRKIYSINDKDAKEIFGDAFYAKSSLTDLDEIEKGRIRTIEIQWEKEGRVGLPSYFDDLNVISARKVIADQDRKAKAELMHRESRTPTPFERKAIEFCIRLMDVVAPELKAIFDPQKTRYTIGNTTVVLGELVKQRSYHAREVYLSATLFEKEFSLFFSTFLHEHAHIFGFDGSRQFTDALTEILETSLSNIDYIKENIFQWNTIRKEILEERRIEKTEANLPGLVDKLPEQELRAFVKSLPNMFLLRLIQPSASTAEAGAVTGGVVEKQEAQKGIKI